jgi:hypothetical protein
MSFAALFAPALAALALLATAPAAAENLVDVEVVASASGAPLPKYRHQGETWVPGTPGERYSIRLANRTGHRVLAVLSVDGVNVVTGETAASRQSGYVLEAWESADISGWRKSLQEVAAFYFTQVPDSYAGRTGRPDHVGVIGVAAFREKREAPAALAPPAPARAQAPLAREAADALGATADARSEESRQKLGTGHGERRHEPTRYVGFERDSAAPVQVVSIRYDARERLVARGVIPQRPRHAAPRPFPGDGFVPDPS